MRPCQGRVTGSSPVARSRVVLICMRTVEFIYEFFKEDGEVVNVALIRNVYQQTADDNPDWSEDIICKHTVLKLRFEFGCPHFGEELADKNDMRPFLTRLDGMRNKEGD